MKDIILQGEGIRKVFARGNVKTAVLDQVDVDIYEKDFTIIMGSSGAGKSTLLYALCGMDTITGGRVLYKGRELGRMRENEMAVLRAKEFGFVFQQAHLVSNLTLLENVAVAGYLSRKAGPAGIREASVQLLEQMGVENAKDRLPSHVSGGEAQRAAIARAMIGHPALLFADEPTGSLNKSHTVAVLNVLTRLNRLGQSILMVTHDLRAAIRGNRILYLEDGKIVDALELPPYEEYGEQQRESRVSRWLSGLQW